MTAANVAEDPAAGALRCILLAALPLRGESRGRHPHRYSRQSGDGDGNHG
jgi:hypothetical protein